MTTSTTTRTRRSGATHARAWPRATGGRSWSVVRERARAGPVYLDASALAKMFITEPDSEFLNRALQGQRSVMVSDLTVTETVSAFARRRREGLLSREAVDEVHGALLSYINSGAILHVTLSPRVHRRAERLLVAQDTGTLRAGDALHLALAIEADVATIVTFDRRLVSAARGVGLQVVP